MGVLIVPLLDLLQNPLVIRLLALVQQLPGAAAGPDLRGGRQEDLHRGLRQHHGADVPAVHDHVVLRGHVPLHIQQQVPDNGVGGYQAGLLGDVLGADVGSDIHAVHDHVLNALFVVLDADGQLVDVAGDAVQVLGADTPQVEEVGHGAVDRPGVHIIIAQFLCQTPGDSAFARPGRAVNGDGDGFGHDDSSFLY